MPALGDCELIRDGLLGQPANALSSIAFVVAGVLILRTRPVLGTASCAAGIGSFLFHGPMPSWAEWAHDVSLALLIVALVTEGRPLLVAAAAGAMGVGFAIWPTVSELVTLVIVLGVVAALGLFGRPWPPAPVALLLVGATFAALSRTGGPLCSPESLVQGHAVWHLLAAGALLSWSRVAEPLALGSRP